jgi:hypothetical protein
VEWWGECDGALREGRWSVVGREGGREGGRGSRGFRGGAAGWSSGGEEDVAECSGEGARVWVFGLAGRREGRDGEEWSAEALSVGPG